VLIHAVLDSNVIISGLLFGGIPSRIINLAMTGKFICYTSPDILDEIRGVLSRPKFNLSTDEVTYLTTELENLFVITFPKVKIRAVEKDPDDDMILECAIESNADLIVSGDSHLLELGQWQGINIKNPVEAMTLFEKL